MKQDWSYSIYSRYTFVALDKLLSFHPRSAATEEGKELNTIKCI